MKLEPNEHWTDFWDSHQHADKDYEEIYIRDNDRRAKFWTIVALIAIGIVTIGYFMI